MIKEKLRRIQDLHGTYQINEQTLKYATSHGKKASLRRQQVFLKEKILSAFRDISDEMQPKLFVVYLTALNGATKTVIMRAESYDDIQTYIRLLQVIRKEVFAITCVKELPTIFEGRVDITVLPNHKL